MDDKKRAQRPVHLRVVVLLAIAIIAAGVSAYLGLLGDLDATIGSTEAHHLLTIVGTAYIAITVPIQRYLKVRQPALRRPLLPVHMYGNLAAVALITAHFAHQLSNLQEGALDVGTGIFLYTAVFLLVFTGILLRFGFLRSLTTSWRPVHIGLAISFYAILVFHVIAHPN